LWREFIDIGGFIAGISEIGSLDQALVDQGAQAVVVPAPG
jgi:hypothetical protein